jgi:SAM-dependent methyltransferase
MDEDNIKNTVLDYYADIATSGKSCCTGSSCCSSSELIQVGDDSIIRESDLGLSCGLPTQYADLKPGETVLDLGSGAGVDVFRAAQIVGPQGYVIGVDMTPEMITRARANAVKGEYTNVEFRLGEIESLPIDDGSIDLVISNCVINLSPDKSGVFSEIFRVLKPGGRVSISDIVTTGNVPESVRQDMSLWVGCISGALDRDVYIGLLEETGFSSIQVHQYQEYDINKGDGYAFASMTFEAKKL